MDPIHTDLRRVARLVPNVTYNRGSLFFLRTIVKLLSRPKQDSEVLIENRHISVEGKRRVPVRIYSPRGRKGGMPALLWIHGGGFISGSLNLCDSYLIDYVKELGVLVCSVDYRFAPEFPYPAGLEDCMAAYQWLSEPENELGLDHTRLAVGGESAGGGLAASLVQKLCAGPYVRPVLSVLRYPMLDDRTCLKTGHERARFLVWNAKSNAFAWKCYLNQAAGGPFAPEFAVPARRSDLRGLVPTLIQVGTCDLFCSECIEYAGRLREANVAVSLSVIPGAFHGFDQLKPAASISRELASLEKKALREAFFK